MEEHREFPSKKLARSASGLVSTGTCRVSTLSRSGWASRSNSSTAAGTRHKVSDDDEITTGKIAWAHPNEFADYCARLPQMEAEAERCWAKERHENGRTVTRLLSDMFSFRQRPDAPHQRRLAGGALLTDATALAAHRNPEGARLRTLAPGHLR